MEGSESLHPIAVLVTELKTEDVTKRVRSLSLLGTISVALGPDRTRSELLPYLIELIDDDPPVQLELAKQLGHFSEYVGGKAHAYVLFDPLEMLAAVEDGEVRGEAVKGICEVARVVGAQSVGDIVLDICKCLSEGASPCSKCSSSQLLASFFPQLSKPQYKDALSLYDSLSKDSNGSTRKAAADNFPPLAQTAGLAAFDILTAFLGDREDGIRAAAVAGLIAMTGSTQQTKRGTMLPLVRGLCEDKATRVRFAIADRMHELAGLMGADLTLQVLSPLYVKLLSDPEPQVRASICSHLNDFLLTMPSDSSATHVLPALPSLPADSEVVKKAFATQIGPVAGYIGERLAKEFLFPVVGAMLRDDCVDVAVSVLRGAKTLVVIGGEEIEGMLMKTLERVLKDKNWRVRLQVTEIVTDFAKCLSASCFFHCFSPSLSSLLLDSSYTIRSTALQCLPQLCCLFGVANTQSSLLPLLLSLKAANTGYTQRITVLKGLQALLPLLPKEAIKAIAMREIVDGSADKVPHVRMNAGRVVGGLKAWLPDEEVELALRTVVDRLRKDGDGEVRKTVESLTEIIEG